MATGCLITFEGVDGCGKTTQLARLHEWLEERGIEDVVRVREPGGTDLGERLREVLLDPATGEIAPAAEALMYAASRAELVAEVIAPALAAGRVVLADRFLDSSLAYQGDARGLGRERVRAANALAVGDVVPALTLLFDVDPEVAAGRRAAEGDDRIEAAGMQLQRRVHAAYGELAAAEPERIHVIDAARDIDAVWGDVLAAARGVLGPAGLLEAHA